MVFHDVDPLSESQSDSVPADGIDLRDERRFVLGQVTPDQDPEARALAREAAELQDFNPSTIVCVGQGFHPGEYSESNPTQMIYAL